jgi:hypothetical protein
MTSAQRPVFRGVIVAGAIGLLLSWAPPFADVVFADGQVHVLDETNPIQHAGVQVRSRGAHSPTTVRLVDGGKIGDHLFAFGTAVVEISGGGVGDDVELHQKSVATITGGRLGNDLEARDQSKITWSGGSLEDALEASDTAVVTVVGQNFNFPYGPVANLSGQLTGTLADGTPIGPDFSRDAGASIILAAPPPTH